MDTENKIIAMEKKDFHRDIKFIDEDHANGYFILASDENNVNAIKQRLSNNGIKIENDVWADVLGPQNGVFPIRLDAKDYQKAQATLPIIEVKSIVEAKKSLADIALGKIGVKQNEGNIGRA